MSMRQSNSKKTTPLEMTEHKEKEKGRMKEQRCAEVWPHWEESREEETGECLGDLMDKSSMRRGVQTNRRFFRQTERG